MVEVSFRKEEIQSFWFGSKLTQPPGKWVIWLKKWELVILTHYSAKFFSSRTCRWRDRMTQIYHVISSDTSLRVIWLCGWETLTKSDHYAKFEPWRFVMRHAAMWASLKVSHHFAKFDAYRSCGSRDMTFYFATWHCVTTWSKGSQLTSRSPSTMVKSYRVWSLELMWKWR